ncbi:MAG: hypothetical protein KDD94_10965, partial [Calditrichaeota bacterium]|nr:hypothetical protein [Calditrichota bacterium]
MRVLVLSPLILISKGCFGSPQSGLENAPAKAKKRVFFTISANHGHTGISLTAADVESNSIKQFLVTGGDH